MRQKLRIRSVVLTVGVVLFLGCGKNDPGANGPLPPLGPADFTTTASALKDEFKADSKAAEAKYDGKVIEVSGTVWSAGMHDDKKRGLLMLVSAGEKMPSCLCIVADRNVASYLGRGQTVRIKGHYFQNIMAPTLTACEIVEKGPDTLVPITAAQLAAEYTSDPDALENKYGKKPLLITGEVVAVKTDENQFIFVELKGDGKTVIEVRYVYLFEGGWPVQFKPGRRVKMAAQTNTLVNKPGVCGVIMDVPLDLE